MTDFTQDQNDQNQQPQNMGSTPSSDDSYVNSYTPPTSDDSSAVPTPQADSPLSPATDNPFDISRKDAKKQDPDNQDPIKKDPGFKTYDKSKTNSPSPQYLQDIVANSPENAANALMPEDMDKNMDENKNNMMADAMKNSSQPPVVSAPMTPPPVVTPPVSDKPMNNKPADNSDNSKAPSNDSSNSNDSQDLEEQNIFDLLGVSDGSDEDKEAFLDELQQVIWEDFLENDVPLLVTLDEKKKVDEISAKIDQSDLDKQEELVVYLEKLIPDLEEIMLEKALELKEDMVRERVNGMREYYADNQEKLDKIAEAENLVAKDQWSSAAKVLNAIPK